MNYSIFSSKFRFIKIELILFYTSLNFFGNLDLIECLAVFFYLNYFLTNFITIPIVIPS